MDYTSRLKAINLSLLEPYKGAKQHHKIKCDKCQHVWTATPVSKIQTYKKYGVNGCPQCKKYRKQKTLNDIKQKNIKIINDKGFEILSEPSQVERRNVISVRNTTCHHVFDVRVGNLLSRNVQCPVCNNAHKRENFQKWNNVRHQEYMDRLGDGWKKYLHQVRKLTEQSYHQYITQINPQAYPRKLAGQEGGYHLDHIVPIRFCFDNNIPPSICAHPQNLQILPWSDNVSNKHKLKEHIPTIFYPYISISTRINQFIDSIVSSLDNIKLEIHSNVLNYYPLTLYFPTQRYGVVFHPLERCVEKTTPVKYFCRELLSLAQSQDIQLLQIFEDEWNNNPQLIISKIKHYVGKSNARKVYARKCTVVEISSKEKNIFLNKYHIQRSDNSTIKLGAYYDEVLVAVMTFSPPRVSVGGKNKTDGTYELVRFATHNDYRVVGIASKLLKHFIVQYAPKEIYSFADMRWSVGNLYTQLGFELKTINPPDYFYVIDGKRKHRWNYRKDVIRKTLSNYDKTLTEYQNMLNHGYDRVWGCGTLKYVLTNPKQ